MKKFISCVLAIVFTLGVFTVGASAVTLGSGVEVIASDVTLIKTGLYGMPLKFKDTDFKTALGTSEFGKITVTKLPDETEGSLMLGERKITEGQSVRRRNLSSLSFVPASLAVSESKFSFTVEDLCGGAEIVCVMKFIEKVNYRPEINTDEGVSLTVTTQGGISVWGDMTAEDPEGDDIDYIIVSYPKYGTLALSDTEAGQFIYTPGKDYEGRDSFVWVARDEYGNYSKTQEVSIKVIPRMSEIVYTDTLGLEEENAVIALTAMGIMSGTQLGDNMYFSPEKSVSRAEFLAMAMKVCGIRADTSLTATFFDDNDEIPAALVGYVAKAQKMGIVNGAFDGEGLKFRPNDAITKYEASIIMSNLIGGDKGDVSVSFDDMYSIPVWARDEVGEMLRLGIFDKGEKISGEETLTRIQTAEYLYKLADKV